MGTTLLILPMQTRPSKETFTFAVTSAAGRTLYIEVEAPYGTSETEVLQDVRRSSLRSAVPCDDEEFSYWYLLLLIPLGATVAWILAAFASMTINTAGFIDWDTAELWIKLATRWILIGASILWIGALLLASISSLVKRI